MSERSYALLRRVESNRLTYDFAVGKKSNGKIGPECKSWKRRNGSPRDLL